MFAHAAKPPRKYEDYNKESSETFGSIPAFCILLFCFPDVGTQNCQGWEKTWRLSFCIICFYFPSTNVFVSFCFCSSAFFVSFCFFPKPVRSKRIFFLPFLAFSLKCFFFSNPTLDLAEQNTVAHHCETAPSIYSVIPIKKAQKKTGKRKVYKKTQTIAGKKTLKSHLDLQKSA